jgi:hypothetical protein
MGYQRKSLGHSSDLKELAKNLDLELEKIESALVQANQVRSLHVEPAKPREGMQAIADGSDWDPGQGQGLYTYIDGAWVKSQEGGEYQDYDDTLQEIADGEWTPANGLELTGSNLQLTLNQRLITIPFHINGGLVVPTTGYKGAIGPIPFAHTIVGASIIGDHASGDIVVDVWRDIYSGYPIDNSDSITASAPLTIVAGDKMVDTTLTGWDVDGPADSIYGFNIDSIADFLWVTVSIIVVKT